MTEHEDPRARDRADREAGQATEHEEARGEEERDGFWEWGKALITRAGYSVGTSPRRIEE